MFHGLFALLDPYYLSTVQKALVRIAISPCKETLDPNNAAKVLNDNIVAELSRKGKKSSFPPRSATIQ